MTSRSLTVLLAAVFLPPLSAAFSPADSLLEEAAYLFQIAGRPRDAASVYQKILLDYPADLYAAEVARHRLSFLQGILPGVGPAPAGAASEIRSIDPLLLWRRKMGSVCLSGVGDAGEYLAAVNAEGYLVCVEKATGSVAWTRRGVNGALPPVVAGGIIYAVGVRGTLAGLSVKDGALGISMSVNLTSPLSQPLGDRLFAASENRALCLRPKTGEVAWSAALPGAGRSTGAPVAGGRFVIFLSGEGEAVALETATGREVWRSGVKPLFPPMLSDDHLILITAFETAAFQLPSGKMLWKHLFTSPVACAAQGVHGLVVVVTEGGKVTGLDAGQGTERFSFAAKASRCAADGDGVYLADSRGVVGYYSFHGTRKWEHPTGETEGFGLFPFAGRLIAATENEGLFAFNVRCALGEDERLSKLRQEVQMLIKTGMVRVAADKTQRALLGLGAGDPELWGLWAALLQQAAPAGSGPAKLAVGAAWEKFFQFADSAQIERHHAVDRLKFNVGARWAAYQPTPGKFSPFYQWNGEILLLGEGEVRALAAEDGRLRWRCRLDTAGASLQTAVVMGDRLICAAEQTLFCLNLKSHQLLWRSALPGRVTELAENGRALYAGTWNHGCFRFDPSTGKVTARLLQGSKALFPFSAQGDIFAAGLEGSLFAFDNSGANFEKRIGDRISAPPIAFGGRIFLPTSLGLLNAFSSRDGGLLWENQPGAQGVSFSAGQGILYVLFANAMVGAFDCASGKPLWVRKGEAESSESMVGDGERLALPGGNRVVVLSATGGVPLYRFSLPGKVAHVLLLGPSLFVRLENGLVFRFDLS